MARQRDDRPQSVAYGCPMHVSIEVDGLRKRFGSTMALNGMTFTVRPGQVTGFVFHAGSRGGQGGEEGDPGDRRQQRRGLHGQVVLGGSLPWTPGQPER